jgi:hypothetical protein
MKPLREMALVAIGVTSFIWVNIIIGSLVAKLGS